MSWLLKQAEALAAQPHPDSHQTAELALGFSSFVEACPVDFLEPLLASPFGRVYRLFLERCCTEKLPGSAAEERKNALSQKLRVSGVQAPEGHGFLLALMPFFQPGNLQVEDAPSKLPGWLLELYQLRYQPANPAPWPEQSTAAPSGSPSFDDRIFLNRMLGLSNLYYIDPEDQEILQELRQVRLQTVELLLGVSNGVLGEHFRRDFGDRFWAMAQSGVQNEPLDFQESAKRDEIQSWLTHTPNSLKQEGGIQRFSAAILFNAPGSVRLADPERNLPAWFLEGYQRYCSMALAA